MTKELLGHQDGWFFWRGGYETRHVPKSAGFRWNPAVKRWETRFSSIAVVLASYADEAARAELDATLEAVEASRATELSGSECDISVPAGEELLPFQQAGVASALRILAQGRGVILADEMGLGKTVQALAVANTVAAESVLIVCPASLRINWRNEADRWLVDAHETFVVTSGKDEIPPAASVVIVNDDLAWRSTIREQLMARKWGLMIVDEAHRMKSPTAKRSRGILGWYDRRAKEDREGLADRADRLILLTGTPLLNRPVELWNLIHAADPSEWSSFFQFARRYCDAHQDRHGWRFDGSSNLGELQTRLRAGVMIRRLKADVLTELPPKRRQVLCLPTNGLSALVEEEFGAWRAHEQEVRDLTAEVESAGGDRERYAEAVSRLTEARNAAFGELAVVRRKLGIAKAPKVVEHLCEQLESEQKIVVFAHHRDVVAALVAGLTEAGHRTVQITGATTMSDRDRAVRSFQEDPDVRVFVGNIQAAGVGLTLTAASLVVFAESDWVPATITQAEDRIHRIGQRRSVLVQHIVLDGSLDARMARQLVAKQAVLDAAIDDAPLTVAADLAEETTPKPGNVSPSFGEEEREAALRALRYLAADDTDRARVLNGVGFSGIDTDIGHSLAECRSLTNRQVALAKKILRKYRRTQLPEHLVAKLWPEQGVAA